MTQPHNETQIENLYNASVFDASGDKIGGVKQVYIDDVTGQPKWVTVNAGWFGTNETFIPLQDATIAGEEIRVPYEKDFIKDAPNLAEDGHLEVEQEQELYRYYSLTSGYEYDTAAAQTDQVAAEQRVADDAAVNREAAVNRDAEGTVTAHEERLNVGKEQYEAGRVHLRKHVVTENQTVNVPLQREELVVERTPLDGTTVVDGKIGEDTAETEITLHAERPVVSKETVATEQVSVGKQVVTENQQVSDEVRKEHIEVEQDGQLRDERNA